MTLVIDTTQDYLFYLEFQKLVSKNTVYAYKYSLKYFCCLFGLKDCRDLDSEDMIKYRHYLSTNAGHKKRGLRESSVSVEMRKIKSYIKWLYERNYL